MKDLFDPRLAVTIGVPALVVVLGWIVAHRLNEWRDRENKKRDIRVQAISRLYMKLALFVNRPSLTEDDKREFESFVAEIQLYGTLGQLALMTTLVEEMKKPNNAVSFDAILLALRDDIRAALSLAHVSGAVWWYRFNLGPASSEGDSPRNGA